MANELTRDQLRSIEIAARHLADAARNAILRADASDFNDPSILAARRQFQILRHQSRNLLVRRSGRPVVVRKRQFSLGLQAISNGLDNGNAMRTAVTRRARPVSLQQWLNIARFVAPGNDFNRLVGAWQAAETA